MKPKPRVLLLSASSGTGHVRAAQALEKAFCERGEKMREAARQMARPNAPANIAQDALTLLD